MYLFVLNIVRDCVGVGMVFLGKFGTAVLVARVDLLQKLCQETGWVGERGRWWHMLEMLTGNRFLQVHIRIVWIWYAVELQLLNIFYLLATFLCKLCDQNCKLCCFTLFRHQPAINCCWSSEIYPRLGLNSTRAEFSQLPCWSSFILLGWHDDLWLFINHFMLRCFTLLFFNRSLCVYIYVYCEILLT